MDAARTDYFAKLIEHETSLWNALDRYLRTVPESVTLGRFGVLRMIDSGEGRARVQDVAEEMGITVGAASRLVDRLESDGLVHRSPNSTDRRGSVLELTEAGTALTETTRQAFDEGLRTLLGGATTQELIELTDRLRRLDDVLRTAMKETKNA